ncbi:hypothetical protein CHU00_05350 [Sphingobacterium cellulitidis]|uniref:S41 family peptidase n=1 Tax=Sphingobacterium cellulitidis TaxID=1768011 RepID=UPI000B943C98|nr:S41 family peptidase [Sphingobacterium cellulitidis]OYD46760.1 hypothetical protein CHU00_05350 [Sphingobacterium cellulitidis]
MLKFLFSLFLLIFLQNIGFSQIDTNRYNLSFKHVENNIPRGWKIDGSMFSDYQATNNGSDTTIFSIKNKGLSQDEVGFVYFDIDDNFAGKKLTLYADISTDSIVSDGSAGLYLSLMPKVDIMNMLGNKVNGTTDWNNFGISINLNPKETKKIRIGIYVIGKGTAKFKNLKLLVDDIDYSKSSVYQPKILSDSIYNFNSHIPDFELTSERIKRIKLTGQVWGLLKYFHPQVMVGKWDMDTELFKFFPSILKDQSALEFEQEIIGWIDQFGVFTKLNPLDQPETDSTKLKADHTWIDKLDFSSDLKQKLKDLTLAEKGDTNVYVSYFEPSTHVSLNEFKYASVSKSDVGFRLLGLFRYWNIIQYYYPYRYLIETPWELELENFIPTFVAANTEAKLDSVYLQLFSKINDTHAFSELSDYYHRGVFGKRRVNFSTKLVENNLVINSLGADSVDLSKSIQVGDVIQSIGGIRVSERVKTLRPFIAASNEVVAMRDLAQRLTQTNADSLELQISNGNKERTITVPTYSFEEERPFPQDTRPYYLIDADIAYLNIGNFVEENYDEFIKILESSKGLILDFRGYPKIYSHELFAKYLFSKKSEYVKFSSNKGFRPGEFRFSYSSYLKHEGAPLYKGKVIVLINEDTQSASEYQVMALRQSANVTVVGSTTAGADGNISWIPLPFGYRTAFSALGVYYPDGTETQGIGIVPDIKVELKVKDVRNRHDPYLAKALQLINK